MSPDELRRFIDRFNRVVYNTIHQEKPFKKQKCKYESIINAILKSLGWHPVKINQPINESCFQQTFLLTVPVLFSRDVWYSCRMGLKVNDRLEAELPPASAKPPSGER